MKYKEFTNNSYGLEAKEVPPKPKTYSDIKEDVKIYDPTGRKHDEAKKYIDTYKGSFRPVPKIVKPKDVFSDYFTLRGPDEKFVADMVNKKGRFKEGNNE
jgi:hypothetical protein